MSFGDEVSSVFVLSDVLARDHITPFPAGVCAGHLNMFISLLSYCTWFMVVVRNVLFAPLIVWHIFTMSLSSTISYVKLYYII